MSYKHVWGFGGVRLIAGGLIADLPYATSEIEFEPIRTQYTTLNQTLYPINLGWRVNITIDAVNACSDDYTEHVTLIEVLNAHYHLGHELSVYPRYSAADNNLVYICNLTSPVNWESIAPTKAAQRVRLTFSSVDPVYQLPTLTSDPTSFNWVYSEDDGATTDNLVTGDGDMLIFKV